jgi:hypothetical protein
MDILVGTWWEHDGTIEKATLKTGNKKIAMGRNGTDERDFLAVALKVLNLPFVQRHLKLLNPLKPITGVVNWIA